MNTSEGQKIILRSISYSQVTALSSNEELMTPVSNLFEGKPLYKAKMDSQVRSNLELSYIHSEPKTLVCCARIACMEVNHEEGLNEELKVRTTETCHRES